MSSTGRVVGWGAALVIGTQVVLGALGVSAAEPAQTVNLTVIGWGTDFDWIKDHPSAFEQTHPGIKLNFVTGVDRNGLVDKVAVSAAAGVGPDVIWTDDGIVRDLGSIDALEPLEPYVKAAKLDVSKYAPMVSGEYNGTLYAFPSVSIPYVYFYNKDLFAAAGIPNPAANWTLDDYKTLSGKLSMGPLGKRTQWGTVSPLHRSLGIIKSAGAWPFTSEGTLDEAGWGRLVDVIEWGRSLTSEQLLVNGDGNFYQGKAAIAQLGSWIFAQPDFQTWTFKWGVQVPPSGETGRFPKFITNGWGISHSSSHKDAAWTFIQWFNAPDHQNEIAGRHEIPAYVPSVHTALNAYGSDVADAFINTLQLAETMPFLTTLQESLAFNNIIKKTLYNAWDGKVSAAAGLGAIKQSVITRLATPIR